MPGLYFFEDGIDQPDAPARYQNDYHHGKQSGHGAQRSVCEIHEQIEQKLAQPFAPHRCQGKLIERVDDPQIDKKDYGCCRKDPGEHLRGLEQMRGYVGFQRNRNFVGPQRALCEFCQQPYAAALFEPDRNQQ